MPTAENALVQYEGGQTVTTMSTLTDSGDHIRFTSAASHFSQKSGYAPVVRPDGLLTGGAVTPAAAAGTDDLDVAALTCYLAGVKTTVSASADESITRPASAVSKVNSITVTSAGAIAVVAGLDGSDANFVETRGAAGGPPYIPVGSIEIAQVRVTADTAAIITTDQIYSAVNQHVERADFPLSTNSYATGEVNFASALPAIHTGDVTKGVYASYANPIFIDISLATDFTPPENSYSVSSTQIYGATIGSSSSSLGQGSFTAYLQDGIADALVALEGENLWFRYYSERYGTNYILSQGKLGITRTFPADDSIKAECTISAESAATNVIA